MSEKRRYDSTVARIAGNLLSGSAESWFMPAMRGDAVRRAVETARAIVAETQRTEPVGAGETTAEKA
jgi:hypothetical protein